MDEVEQREWKCIKILVENTVLTVAFNVKTNLIRIRSNDIVPIELLAKDCIDDEKEIPYAVVQLYKNNFKI